MTSALGTELFSIADYLIYFSDTPQTHLSCLTWTATHLNNISPRSQENLITSLPLQSLICFHVLSYCLKRNFLPMLHSKHCSSGFKMGRDRKNPTTNSRLSRSESFPDLILLFCAVGVFQGNVGDLNFLWPVQSDCVCVVYIAVRRAIWSSEGAAEREKTGCRPWHVFICVYVYMCIQALCSNVE